MFCCFDSNFNNPTLFSHYIVSLLLLLRLVVFLKSNFSFCPLKARKGVIWHGIVHHQFSLWAFLSFSFLPRSSEQGACVGPWSCVNNFLRWNYHMYSIVAAARIAGIVYLSIHVLFSIQVLLALSFALAQLIFLWLMASLTTINFLVLDLCLLLLFCCFGQNGVKECM